MPKLCFSSLLLGKQARSGASACTIRRSNRIVDQSIFYQVNDMVLLPMLGVYSF
jgi:hypothetical protein